MFKETCRKAHVHLKKQHVIIMHLFFQPEPEIKDPNEPRVKT
jgi:hypothetical protein